MIRICKENKNSVLNKIRNGKLDSAVLSTTNLIDEIILAMYTHGILSHISKAIPDFRAHNTIIPYELIWASAIAAKMKIKTSLTDIPYAITDHRTLAKLGYTIIDTENGLQQGLMQEGSLRFLIKKYTPELIIKGYNTTVQKYILPSLKYEPNIHILDCTDLEVNYYNLNYEGSGLAYSKRNQEKARGYKLATLRGIIEDSGIIEEIRFGPLNVHDLTLSEEMLRTTPMLKPKDILINDRGFLSRSLINYLKTVRHVDTYIPLRNNMDSYQVAVQVAIKKNRWQPHPLRKFKTQKICLVESLGDYWEGNDVDKNVDINACVVWEQETDNYFVFATTDLSQSAANILRIYSLRPEIEEDYRQLKDFWKLEDFKSTKLNMIVFHIVSVLFGYLFFQLYTLLPEGEQYFGKSLPVVLKNYMIKVQGYIVFFAGREFGVFTLLEVMELYASCSCKMRQLLNKIFQNL